MDIAHEQTCTQKADKTFTIQMLIDWSTVIEPKDLIEVNQFEKSASSKIFLMPISFLIAVENTTRSLKNLLPYVEDQQRELVVTECSNLIAQVTRSMDSHSLEEALKENIFKLATNISSSIKGEHLLRIFPQTFDYYQQELEPLELQRIIIGCCKEIIAQACANSEFQLISELTDLWQASFGLLLQDGKLELTSYYFEQLISFESRGRFMAAFSILKFLIEKALVTNGVSEVLYQFLEQENVVNYVAKNNDFDGLFITAMNDSRNQLEGPYKFNKCLISFFYNIIKLDGKRLTTVLSGIKLHDHSSVIVARVFTKIAFNDSSTSKSRWIFLHSLYDSQLIDFFNNKIIVDGYEQIIVDTYNQKLQEKDRSFSVDDIMVVEAQPKFNIQQHTQQVFHIPAHKLMTPIFLRSVLYNENEADNIAWFRVIYLLGVNLPPSEQYETCSQICDVSSNGLLGYASDTSLSFYPQASALNKIRLALLSLHNYYLDKENFSTSYSACYDFIINRIVWAFAEMQNHSLLRIQEIISAAIDNIISPSPDWLNEIFSYQDKALGKYESGLDAIMDLLKKSLKESDPNTWSTSDFSDKIYFLYCYACYPLQDYIEWFIKANKTHMSDEMLKNSVDFFNDFYKEAESLTGYSELASLGYKVVPNSQITAMLMASKITGGNQHLFGRIGTGQGKSLIIAMTALQYAKNLGRIVHVYTCYSHLAKRDFERFQKLFENNGIKAALVTSETKTIEANVQIVYANLNDFNTFLRKQIDELSKNRLDACRFNILCQDVVILDEVDSLILDHRLYFNTVNDQLSFLEFSPSNIYDLEEFKSSMGNDMLIFLQAMERHGLDSLFSTWHTIERGRQRTGRTERNSLGHKVNYIGSFMYELKENSKFYVKNTLLDGLSYLVGFKTTIGFSGSMDLNGFNRLAPLYKKGGSEPLFIEFPPFYGNKANKNKAIMGSLVEPSVPTNWLLSLKEDAEHVMLAKRPVLVFANINNPDEWQQVEGLIKQLAQQYEYRIQVMKSESHVSDQTLSQAGKLKTITLASNIVGRGADFLVPIQVLKNGGLHVIVSYLPTNDRNKLDSRQLIQMIGRTGRWGKAGSHSIIVSQIVAHEEQTPLEIVPQTEFFHNLSIKLYTMLIVAPYDKTLWKCWFYFNRFADDSNDIPSALAQTGNSSDEIAQFLFKNIFSAHQDNLPDLDEQQLASSSQIDLMPQRVITEEERPSTTPQIRRNAWLNCFSVKRRQGSSVV